MLIDLLRKIFSKNQTVNDAEIDYNSIQKIVKYRFNNRQYLSEAFKHRSYLIINREPAYNSNERLEFLGDAVLDLVVTEFLFSRFPQDSEGILSKIKSVLVSRKVLAQIISELKLGDYLLLNRGEEQTGGRSRFSNLANLYESILGAIYLDGGLKSARKFILYTLLDNYDKYTSDEDHLNYKSLLLEYAQKNGLGNPKYLLICESGPDHDKEFEIDVSLPGADNANGKGKSKKVAEQNSARNLLQKIAPEIIEKSI